MEWQSRLCILSLLPMCPQMKKNRLRQSHKFCFSFSHLPLFFKKIKNKKLRMEVVGIHSQIYHFQLGIGTRAGN